MSLACPKEAHLKIPEAPELFESGRIREAKIIRREDPARDASLFRLSQNLQQRRNARERNERNTDRKVLAVPELVLKRA